MFNQETSSIAATSARPTAAPAGHNRRALSGRDRGVSPSARPTAAGFPRPPNSKASAVQRDFTTFRPRSRAPSRDGSSPTGSASRVAFFRAYPGSGLVIHCFARCQRTPSRLSVTRIVSPVTRSLMIPSLQQTAARSSIQRLVGLPKARGDWCKRVRNRSAATASKAAVIRCGRDDPSVRVSSPDWLKAWIALRTVWVWQPRARAMAGTCSCRAEARRIWQRRKVKAAGECNPRYQGVVFAVRQRTDEKGCLHDEELPHARLPLLTQH